MTKAITYGSIIYVTLTTWLIGFLVVLSLDTYTDKKRKTFFFFIILLVYAHIMQNYIDYCLMTYYSNSLLRTGAAVFGYSIRPLILVLFAHIIEPKKKHLVAWILVGINVLMHLTAFWTRLVFIIEDNVYYGGPLRYWCLLTSMILLVYLVYLSAAKYVSDKFSVQEVLFHLFWSFVIIAGIVADIFVNKQKQWVDYLSISMACVSVFSYIWFHQLSVKEYEENFLAEQRIRIIRTQVQPHFIYNTLSAIRNIDGNPDETKKAISEFANYIRGSLAALDGKDLISFTNEMNVVKDYVSLQQLRFPDRFDVEYSIEDEDFSLPPLTVQILVENAIKHGILVGYDRKTIIIKSYTEKNGHVVKVIDDGVGFDPKTVNTTGRVGLRAVTNRLDYFLDATISIESEKGKGTEITIYVPKK